MSSRSPLKTASYPVDNMHEMALELKNLLSPEKALLLLFNLVDKKPDLWHDLNAILNPSEPKINQHIEPQDVLTNLRALQLKQLPLDTIGVISEFLSLEGCLQWSQTATFFRKTIPKYIDVISLERDICDQIYSLFAKCERLKHLSVDGTYQDHNIDFSFPFAKMKALKELILVNTRFTKPTNDLLRDMYTFDGGKYNLQKLQLISCENMDVDNWIKVTSAKHSPDLSQITIRTYRRMSNIVQQATKDTIYTFTKQLVSSRFHHQITNLSLTIHDVELVQLMRGNKHFIHNLQKFEIGLMDRRCQEDDASNISTMFQSLLSPQKSEKELYNFENLKILIIDFCPNIYSRGYNDISGNDLKHFAENIPSLFPQLQLLGLYGSMSQLLFNDEHLNGLLSSNVTLSQIIDLSLGFEGLSGDYDHLMRDLSITFPNLAWLTFENEQFLMDSERFHQSVNDVKTTNLEWITLCASEKDEIYELSNGIFIEYWERGIEQCDFDAALLRSQQIVQQRSSSKTRSKQNVQTNTL